MFDKGELENWLVEVSRYVSNPVTIYLIGGCAMSFKGYKAATKDIDIVMLSKSDFDVINKAIMEADYKLETDLEDEFYLTALAVYVKGDSRIDIFLKKVGKMLAFTPKMAERANIHNKFDQLIVALASNEDIFLFKSMTPRPEDIKDCELLIQTGLEWNTVYDEILEQSKAKDKWFFWTFEKVCIIENETKIPIPIKPKLLELVKKHWKHRPSDFMSNVINLDNHLPKKYQKYVLKNSKERI